METVTTLFIQFFFILFTPPLFVGIINKTKAFFAGRKSPLLLQNYYDLFKLLQKDPLFSKTTTWMFQAGPAILIVTMIIAALVVPFGHSPAPLSFRGDILVLISLFALARFFLTLSALDTGSAFEGMGASREVSFAIFIEPALFLCFLALSRLTEQLSVSAIFETLSSLDLAHIAPILLLIGVSLFIILLAENCRIPFDDPNTHLELTMIHEVMVLDHGGPSFGFVLYGSALKLLTLSSLLVHILFPYAVGGLWLDTFLFFIALSFVAVGIGIVESSMARIRLLNFPRLLIAASILPAFAIMLLIR